MCVCVVTYPPVIKKGGQEAELCAIYPAKALSELTVDATERLHKQLSGLSVRNEAGAPVIVRTTLVYDMQDARNKAAQLGHQLREFFAYEPVVQPAVA